MNRPRTVQDVFDTLAHDRIVEPARLRAFAERHAPVDVAAALARLVTDGLLTAYQADEVGCGRASGLWLGAYRVLDRLGKGGMGQVFLAEHSVLGRRAAIKVLSDALRADPGARRRFVREARAAATLDHPNIVHVFDVDMAHEPPYLVMEYVDGISLQAAVARTGTFSAGEAAAVGVQVADGLAQAAAVGLVHRDIKPANLLVDRRGAVKILDLGIVCFTHEGHSRTNGPAVILGTLDYLAPEQAEDSSRVDPRADIYALGATLYFLIAGHPPYPVADVRQKLAAKRDEDPPPLNRLRPDVPPEFADLVRRLMARDPNERFAIPGAVVAALHPWAQPAHDFPGRLFRPSSDSTAHDRRATDHEPACDPLPDTLCIVKPPARRVAEPLDVPIRPPAPAAESSAPGPTEEISPEHGTETEGPGGHAAPTDEILAPRTDRFEVPAALRPAAPPAAPNRPARTRIRTRVVTLALVLLAAALAALVTRAVR